MTKEKGKENSIPKRAKARANLATKARAKVALEKGMVTIQRVDRSLHTLERLMQTHVRTAARQAMAKGLSQETA